MDLTPREKDKLLVAVAAMVARRRLERGVKLNYPEAIALITDFVLEGARDGRSVAELMSAGATVLTPRAGHGGRRRDDPRGPGRGDLPRRHQARHRPRADPLRAPHDPGEYRARGRRDHAERRSAGDHARRRQHRRPADPGRLALPLLRDQRRRCASTAPRPAAAPRHPGRHRGALRARPDAARSSSCRYGGARAVYGFNGQIMGALDRSDAWPCPIASSRRLCRTCSGRPSGDKVRLADTELFIEVEEDRTIYGEEVKFGGGKVIRDGMGQCAGDPRRRAPSTPSSPTR